MIGVCTGLFLFRKERKFAYEITTLLVAAFCFSSWTFDHFTDFN